MTTTQLDRPQVDSRSRVAITAANQGWLTRQRVRQAGSFLAVGTIATGLYLVLCLVLRTGMSAFTANLIAQVVSTLFSTAANRRFTFRVTDLATVARHHLQMLALLAVNLLLNTLTLTVLAAVAPAAGSLVELLVLSASGLLVTAARVVTMNRWQHGS